MPAVVHSITVTDSVQMDRAIASYIQQGYNLANRSERYATLVKRKQFSILWLVIGIITLTVVLWIYIIVYLFQSDHMVQIVLQPYAPQQATATPGLVSADGLWQWDGASWRALPQGQAQPVRGAGATPAIGAISADGLWRWDGLRWQPTRAPLTDGDAPPGL
jgi:hypothetical protein